MLFSDWLYAEVGQEYVDKVKNFDTDRPFDNIFGAGNMRVIIPLLDSKQQEFKNSLGQLGLNNIDLVKGTATRQSETNQGTKEVLVNIGRAIQQASKKNPEYQKLLQWWEKNKPAMGKSTSGTSIIISRSPIDILKMSDHEGMRSCHAPKGSFFHCAIQEAKTGGAVAYLVKNYDVEKFKSDNNLNDINDANEIFKDHDRGLKFGIVPLQRLRLRRFTDNKVDLLLPEKRTYGIEHVGFKDAVIDWAKNSQRNIMATQPNFDEFKLRGGSYQDNDADELWNDFFGGKVIGTKNSVDRGDERNNASLLSMAQDALEGHNFQHYTVDVEDHADGDNKDERIIFMFMTHYLFPRDMFLGIPSEEELENKVFPRGKNAIPGSNYNIFLNNPNYVQLLVESDWEQGTDVNDFERFLDHVDYFDSDYFDHKKRLYDNLVANGFIKKQEFELKNFSIRHDNGYYFDINPFEIGDLNGLIYPVYQKPNRPDAMSDYNALSTATMQKILDNLNHLMAGAPKNAQLFPFINNHFLRMVISGAKEIKLQPGQVIANSPPVILGFGSTHTKLPSDIVDRLIFLEKLQKVDNQWNAYVNRAKLWFNQTKKHYNMQSDMISKLPWHGTYAQVFWGPDSPMKDVPDFPVDQ